MQTLQENDIPISTASLTFPDVPGQPGSGGTTNLVAPDADQSQAPGDGTEGGPRE